MTAVIPVYNGEAFIATAVQSVLAQTYGRVECIVVDDGSSDSTGEVVRTFGNSVTYLRKDNAGVSSARNVGAAAARGAFVAFLDADDVWEPHKLERQLRVFDDLPAAGLVYTSLSVVDERLEPIDTITAAPPTLALRNTLLMEQPFAMGTTAMLPVEVFRSLGGFDERLSTSADCDLVCRVALHHPLGCCPEPLTRYRRHPSQMHLELDTFERDMLLIFEKFFQSADLPSEVAALRRRATANLWFMLAVAHFRRGNRPLALRRLVSAALQDPVRAAGLLSDAVRRSL